MTTGPWDHWDRGAVDGSEGPVSRPGDAVGRHGLDRPCGYPQGPRPGEDCLSDTALYWLVLLARRHRTELAKDLADLGMYGGQEQVLLQRWGVEGYTHQELAQRVQAAPATITRMLQRMERAGLVHRQRYRGERSSRVFLTEQGWTARATAEVLWWSAEERLVGNLSGSEYGALRALLAQMSDS